MLKSKKIVLILLSSLICTSLLISCSSKSSQPTAANNSSSSTSTNTPDSSSSNKNKDSKESVTALDAYKKINLGMTKDEVDKTLGLEAKEDASGVKGTFNYSDPNTKYGVSILYNDQNIVYAKTALFGSHSVLAPLCTKAVSEGQESKLTKGMDYKDVVSILGGDGIEMNNTAFEGDPTKSIGVIRIWVNKDGSGLQVIFSKDDKVSDAMYFDHD